MGDRIFLDTNILVYSYEQSADPRYAVARELILRCFRGEVSFVISNQVLAEFFQVITCKSKFPLSKTEARQLISFLIECNSWTKVDYTHTTLLEATSISHQYNISIWDALIAATMVEHNIHIIYTENEADFRKVPLLKVVNPFKKN
ncbi:MAG: hypothetical protein A2729_03520 [Candidatus Buchananbacteria bacterium RIFCSPHIGHO2_01_FULL_39_14]|uniref:PIN domain-containing protein n=1 Tax=Candidatus Buchananbacteria bacterium RIFCSPHIGHO2_01_FULL_39_14 TaxID=1797532 RepID=A0A1G1XXG7_9BACT|nr:MAG: hypothetical protein A2729_03520 [Candidatus Buchananbacteria bacterium RIFCSPHIGHO2_01_FULL_39_14]